MVKSGLVDRPDVSHYRLTTHLGLAVFLYIALRGRLSGMLVVRRIMIGTAVQNGLVDCSSWYTALYYQEVW